MKSTFAILNAETNQLMMIIVDGNPNDPAFLQTGTVQVELDPRVYAQLNGPDEIHEWLRQIEQRFQ